MSNQSNHQDNSLSSVLEIIRKITEKLAGGQYIYRGEPEHYPKICSGLYREYQDIETDSFDIETVQTEILTEAKNYTDEVSDFNILVDIQRYGGKTNLIEFTTDYLVALFFACYGFPDQDGRVILQRTEEIKDIIYHPWSKPQHLSSIQKVVFLRPPKGFIQPKASDIITIPQYLKQSILEYLLKTHSISTKTIYNDLYGFVMSHGIHQSAYTEFHRGLTWQQRGIEAKTPNAKQNSYEKAIRHYTQTLVLKPDDADAYYHRGLMYFSIDEFAKAIANYNKTIELKPDNVDAYYHRGLTYFSIDEFAKAIANYNKTIELKPDNVDAYYHRGLAHLYKGEYNKAISDYSKTIELKPDNVDAYYHRGLAHLNKGEYNKAISDYSKTIELKPDNADAYHHRGLTYASKNEIDLAISDYSKAIDLDPSNADFYDSRNFAYRIKGEVERAIADYNKAMELKQYDTSEQIEVTGFLHSMKLRFDEAISQEPYYRIFVIPARWVSNAVQTQDSDIDDLLRNPPDVRKGAFGFTGVPEVLPIPDGVSGSNISGGEIILLNNGFLELRCPLSNSMFQWQISTYKMFSDLEWLYPYVVCEFPVTFLRLVEKIYTKSRIDCQVLVQQEYHNLNGFLLVGRHPGDPRFGIFENERRVYKRPYPLISKKTVNPDFTPDQVAYDLATDVYTFFGLSTELMPDLFDEERKFVL